MHIDRGAPAFRKRTGASRSVGMDGSLSGLLNPAPRGFVAIENGRNAGKSCCKRCVSPEIF